jgi:hypothetical protein
MDLKAGVRPARVLGQVRKDKRALTPFSSAPFCWKGELINMTIKACINIGDMTNKEITESTYKGADLNDIVVATNNDVIYFYHISSCLAAIFYNKNPMGSGEYTFVGVHLVVSVDEQVPLLPKYKGLKWFGYEDACRHYIVELQRFQGRNFGYVAFVGHLDWKEAALEMKRDLKIETARFYDEPEDLDVWAYSNGDIKKSEYRENTVRTSIGSLPGLKLLGNVKTRAGGIAI